MRVRKTLTRGISKAVLICLLTSLLLFGCGDSGQSEKQETDPGYADSGQTEKRDVDSGDKGQTQNQGDDLASGDKSQAEKNTVDVDLSVLTGTLVYSEVYNMLATPEDYIGKRIKITGMYATKYDSEKDKRYFACIVQDATACCLQGMEFLLTDDFSYPEDYPSDGEEITVTGEFETYKEGELVFCRLKNAELE